MTAGRVLLDIMSGVRNPDDHHPGFWAAVGIGEYGDEEPRRLLDAATAITFGARIIRMVGEHPDKAFAPEVVPLPAGAGLDGDQTASLGLQLIVSGVKATCELAIAGALARRGWTEKDKLLFMTEVIEKTSDSLSHATDLNRRPA